MMIVLLILTIVCAVQAIRASQLMNATIWLAAVSALVAVMLYHSGAWQIAVIELSVGAGLVTVLMVFAITMVGNENEPIGEKRLPLLLTIGSIFLLILLTVPLLPTAEATTQQPQSDVLWQVRGLDLVLQVVLIFSGVLGVIGLLSAAKSADAILRDFPSIHAPDPKPEQYSQTPDKEVA